MPLQLNYLVKCAEEKRICPAFGVKIINSLEVVAAAKSGGFQALFIDLEHSALSLLDAQQLCIGALSAGLSPYVRVPAQCGSGYVQKVLDNGAMGVIFPHINSVDDAKAAIKMAKYPPLGKRSVVSTLPQLGFEKLSLRDTIEVVNAKASSVILMIESKEGLDNVDAIASLDGLDCVFVGTNDLSVELGVPGDFDCQVFTSAMQEIAQAAQKHGKILGLAGIYDRPDLLEGYIKQLGFTFVVGSQDVVLLAQARHVGAALLKIAQ